MKKSHVLCSVVVFLLTVSVGRAQRQSSELPDGWKFIRQDAAPDAPVDSWDAITVPHCWNALDGQIHSGSDKSKDYYRGPAWYARSLDIPAAWKGKRVFLRFEAASIVAQPYLNGQPLDEHRGAFTAFCRELTPTLHFGAPNELRVKVDNSHFEDVPPLSGDFNMNGGIYRPVHLIVTSPVCITPLDSGSPGVYLTVKELQENRAVVDARTLVSNGLSASASVQVQVDILDATGNVVATQKKPLELPAGQTLPIVHSLSLAHPHLWNGRNDPYLYSAIVRVLRDGANVDELKQPLGLRTVQITQKEGFLLNGRPYAIHGVNKHQDTRDKGWALSREDHERDVKLMLEMGVTAVRLAHYPQSEYLHDLADRAGLLLWNEVSLVNKVSKTPEFDANAEQQLRELILQRYNHPAAAFWGLHNELDVPNGVTALPLLHHLNEVAHQIDPTRPTVEATCHDKQEVNKVADWPAFNRYPGWYGKEMMDAFSKWIDAYASEVGRRVAVSEYGAGANPHQHEDEPLQKPQPNQGEHPEEWQAYVHEQEWAQIQHNPNLWGSFVWVMFDFPSQKRNEGGNPAINDKGLVTQDRQIKKDAFFLYQANWTEKPMVHLNSSRFTSRSMTPVLVKAYSNCASVELFVNGKSLGAVAPDAVHLCRWENISLQPGTNHVEAVGKTGVQEARDVCDWSLLPAAVSGGTGPARP
jgi:beta-galactosidase